MKDMVRYFEKAIEEASTELDLQSGLPEDLPLDIRQAKLVGMARLFREIKKTQDVLDAAETLLKSLFIANGESIYLPEFMEKVAYKGPGTKTAINVRALVNELVENDRLEDLMQIISITQKAVEGLKDGELLKARFKEEAGSTSASISLTSMTKKELQELATKNAGKALQNL